VDIVSTQVAGGSTYIDLNCDMGESFGRYTLGNDAKLMPLITSANIACGWHASDPGVMRETVAMAVDRGVAIGAHVGFPDLLGFGRRRLQVTLQEIYDYTLYQAGALMAFAQAAGSRIHHVKPHGAFYVMCSEDREMAGTLCRAIKTLGGDVILVMMGDVARQAASEVGIPFAAEGYVDLDYDSQGHLVLERHKGARDPEKVAQRAERLVREHRLPTVDGADLTMAVDTICIHGDAPNAPAIARQVRERLAASGIQVRPLRQFVQAG
jgi:UPF0271 protein